MKHNKMHTPPKTMAGRVAASILWISVTVLLISGCIARPRPRPQISDIPAAEVQFDQPSETSDQLSEPSSSGSALTGSGTEAEATVSASTNDDAGSIPSDAVQYDGHYYYIYPLDDIPVGMTPEEFCRERGGYMATLSTATENDWAGRYAYTHGFDTVLFGMRYDRNTDQSWWENGEPVDFTMWWNAEARLSGGDEYTAFTGWDVYEGLGEITAGTEGGYHTEASRTYEPDKMIDGDITTAWVEGASGDGIGESVTFSFYEPVVIFSVLIDNGYQKREDLFYRNARPKKIQLTFADGDYINTQEFDLSDQMDTQELELNPLVLASKMTLTVLDVYPGTEFRDTAISELDIRAIYPVNEWTGISWDYAKDNPEHAGVLCEWDAGILRFSTPTPSVTHITGDSVWTQIPGEFIHKYSSGGILLDISSDGIFKGDYHVMYRGDSGESYPDGTRYYCSFTGAFSVPEEKAESSHCHSVKQEQSLVNVKAI